MLLQSFLFTKINLFPEILICKASFASYWKKNVKWEICNNSIKKWSAVYNYFFPAVTEEWDFAIPVGFDAGLFLAIVVMFFVILFFYILLTIYHERQTCFRIEAM